MSNIYIYGRCYNLALITMKQLYRYSNPFSDIRSRLFSFNGLLSLVPLFTLVVNFAMTTVFMAASSTNYPGGVAMSAIHQFDHKGHS